MKANKMFLKLKKGFTNPEKYHLTSLADATTDPESEAMTFYVKPNHRADLKFLKDNLVGHVVQEIEMVPYQAGVVKILCDADTIVIDVYYNVRYHGTTGDMVRWNWISSWTLTRDDLVQKDLETFSTDLVAG